MSLLADLKQGRVCPKVRDDFREVHRMRLVKTANPLDCRGGTYGDPKAIELGKYFGALSRRPLVSVNKGMVL